MSVEEELMEKADPIQSLEARVSAMEQKWKLVSSEVLYLKESMDANTIALKEYIEISKQLKVGMRLLGYVESIAVWFTKVLAAIGAAWVVWKFLVVEAIDQAVKK